MRRSVGFTIVELLVVVTVILVLLALLAPAMDKAVYEAELTVCAANQRAVATSVTAYALDFSRFYPHRPGVPVMNTIAEPNNWQPAKMVQQGRHDERPALKDYVQINKMLNDPLLQTVNIENAEPGITVYASQQLWYGWRYLHPPPRGGKGMYRLGDAFEWEGVRHDPLISDRHTVYFDINPGAVVNHHPDSERITFQTNDDGQEGTVFARWHFVSGRDIGLHDLNEVGADGALQQTRHVVTDALNEGIDERLTSVPIHPINRAAGARTYITK